MRITKPGYFDTFRCVGGSCPDSCCKDWEVEVDGDSAEFYRALPGSLGEKLRAVLKDTEDGTVMILEAGRCPMWDSDGLCRIQKELGETALCQVCKAFPRLTHDYGGFIEYGLELSCPEAAKLILSAGNEPMVTSEIPGTGDADYDQEAMDILLASREEVLSLLSDETRPFGQCLALALLYGCQVQSALDGGELAPFDPDASLETAREWAKPGDMGKILEFFSGLEILTPQWRERLRHPAPRSWEDGDRAFARYLTQRYWLQAVSDYDLYGRVKFLVTACLTVRHLGGSLLETAQLFSKEVENDADALDALLNAAYESPAFRDANLLGLTFSGQV